MKTAMRRYLDRRMAGRELAGLLPHYAHRSDVVVIGLSRGGIPVAYEVAQALQAPLDVLVVRKLGMPGHTELAMGAIAGGDVRVLNMDVVSSRSIPMETIDAVASRERRELEQREERYRSGRVPAEISGRIVILVDDGLATGSTMDAAVHAVKQSEPAKVIVAVPVAARDACARFQEEVDECVCALVPANFYAVGTWYDDFQAVSDEQVQQLLEQASPHDDTRTNPEAQ
jgi:predicted phosphoribosyltransferase